MPLLKVNDCTKDLSVDDLSVDDFRGISISPVVSKIFEHCIQRRFSKHLVSSDNQFGVRNAGERSHTLFTVRPVVDLYIFNGSIVNLCALDISKAFDKLMSRLVPIIPVLLVLEYWFTFVVLLLLNGLVHCFHLN